MAKQLHPFAFLIVNGHPVIARYFKGVRAPIVRRAGRTINGPLWRYVATRNFGR